MAQIIRRSGRVFLDRTFSVEEQAYCNSKRMKFEHYAARLAAKEAVLKALKIKPGRRYKLSEIAVNRETSGKPYIVLAARTRESLRIPSKAQIELSLAHEREYAIATVVIVIP